MATPRKEQVIEMSGLTRTLVLALSLTAMLTATGSSASAVTWHNSGDTAFTATGGLFSIPLWTCTGSTVTGTVTGSTFAGAVWSAIDGTSVTTCIAGSSQAVWHCSFKLTATAQDLSVATTGTLDRTCVLSNGLSQSCGFTGTTPVTYTNPIGAVTGRFTLSESTIAPLECATTGTGVQSFSWSHHSLTVTAATGGPAPHAGPRFTRTP